MLEGSCLCGGVRYGITGGLVGRINYCHCSQCRKASGSRCGSPLFKRVGNKFGRVLDVAYYQKLL